MIGNVIQFALSGQIIKVKSSKWLLIRNLFFIGLLIHLCFSIINTLFIFLGYMEKQHHPTLVRISEHHDINNILLLIFSTVVLTPLLEELSYRYPISRSKTAFSFGSGFMLIITVLAMFQLHEKTGIDRFLAFILLFFPASFVIGFLLYRIKFNPNKLRLNVVAFVSCCLFALSHFNVTNQSNSPFITAFTLMPYFLTGYLFCYLRVSTGFVYSAILHFAHNLFIVSLNLIAR